jgi:pimeloyl-ACP methyl ester carboxylesterase
MLGWEDRLSRADTNRVVREFEWGLDWLGLPGAANPLTALQRFNELAVRSPAEFFAYQPPADYQLSGSTLRFTSPVQTPYPENNVVWAEWFEARHARGRAVVVVPQWNSSEDSHLNLCRLLARLGISALRLSKAYHHRRKPEETARADYHVSSNLGRTIHATRQSVVDARACLDWLEARGYHRLGIVGTSLGSCVALLTVAADERIRRAVFNHVSLRFADVVWSGASCRHIRQVLENRLTLDELRACWAVISPVSYLAGLGGRELESLLIWARYDTTFLPEQSREVLQTFRHLGLRHRVAALPCGHYTTAKKPFVWLDGWAIVRFLHQML